ncbi:MAG: hypothetical protein JNK29_17310, partial [Anaerolineales bacterium]|nr:hypothetical protein [Anaerolineales bacterium]
IVLNVKRPVAWEGVVNQQLADGVARWPQAALIDWNALGSAQPGWFIADQVHPNPAGAEAYAALIQQLLAEQP